MTMKLSFISYYLLLTNEIIISAMFGVGDSDNNQEQALAVDATFIILKLAMKAMK